ncbi:hypothetical protein OS190_16640 [Sulfitobacter sp. F26204]|uniref:hypothetical protein n=1 Tax=Sulfitobacter sp. F26204 TaxID=2996014 RepID=UPI00225E5D80|nr:hypothetical protein [Sulfitobacter sp. F26204]MCX7561199.1 hypothetical protein [Sulfitobacter sp. F26204]
MFDFNQSDQPSIPTRSLSRVLRNTPLTLPAADHQKLQEHLEDCECAMRPSSRLLAYVLANKLMNTRPVDDVHQSDLVVGGSCVTYRIDAAEPQTGLLVHRARSGLTSGVIPVASLLGATLIGMRAGQRAPLLFEDGSIGRLCVIDVASSV